MHSTFARNQDRMTDKPRDAMMFGPSTGRMAPPHMHMGPTPPMDVYPHGSPTHDHLGGYAMSMADGMEGLPMPYPPMGPSPFPVVEDMGPTTSTQNYMRLPPSDPTYMNDLVPPPPPVDHGLDDAFRDMKFMTADLALNKDPSEQKSEEASQQMTPQLTPPDNLPPPNEHPQNAPLVPRFQYEQFGQPSPPSGVPYGIVRGAAAQPNLHRPPRVVTRREQMPPPNFGFNGSHQPRRAPHVGRRRYHSSLTLPPASGLKELLARDCNWTDQERQDLQRLVAEEDGIAKLLHEVSGELSDLHKRQLQCHKEMDEEFQRAYAIMDERRQTLQKAIEVECDRHRQQVLSKRTTYMRVADQLASERRTLQHLATELTNDGSAGEAVAGQREQHIHEIAMGHGGFQPQASPAEPFRLKFLAELDKFRLAMNDFGTVQTPGGQADIAPKNVRVECTAWNKLKVSWSADPQCRVDRYVVFHREVNKSPSPRRRSAQPSSPHRWQQVELAPVDTECVLTNLRSQTTYEVFVAAKSLVHGVESHSRVFVDQVRGGFLVGMSANSIHVYDIERDCWSRVTSMDGLDVFKPALLVHNQELLRVGGEKKFCHFSQVHSLHLSTQESRSLPAMKIKRACCQACVMKDKLIVCGGCDRMKNLFDVEQLCFATQKWTRLASMIMPRGSFALCCIGSKLYVAGGFGRNGSLKSAEAYNSERNVWTQLPEMTYARRGCVGIAWKGKFVVVGGQEHGDTVEVYDPTTSRWECMPDLNQPHYRPVVGLYKSRLVVVGNNLEFDSYEVYDDSKRCWVLKIIKDAKKLRAAAWMG